MDWQDLHDGSIMATGIAEHYYVVSDLAQDGVQLDVYTTGSPPSEPQARYRYGKDIAQAKNRAELIDLKLRQGATIANALSSDDEGDPAPEISGHVS
jgi:hypothetical protein